MFKLPHNCCTTASCLVTLLQDPNKLWRLLFLLYVFKVHLRSSPEVHVQSVQCNVKQPWTSKIGIAMCAQTLMKFTSIGPKRTLADKRNLGLMLRLNESMAHLLSLIPALFLPLLYLILSFHVRSWKCEMGLSKYASLHVQSS